MSVKPMDYMKLQYKWKRQLHNWNAFSFYLPSQRDILTARHQNPKIVRFLHTSKENSVIFENVQSFKEKHIKIEHEIFSDIEQRALGP
jgi:ribosomal protein L32E